VICHEQYVGQTSNKFSKRWSAHRSNRNKQDCKTNSDKDQMALSRNYSENHGTVNKPPLLEAYTVTFVEQPSCHSLDICENKCYHPNDAQINIQNMILPHVKYLLRCFVLFDSIRCCLPLCTLAFISKQLAYSHRSV